MTKDKMASHMPVFRHLLPTFCQTATPGYDYQFYFAFDYNDTVFSQEEGLKDFLAWFVAFRHAAQHGLHLTAFGVSTQGAFFLQSPFVGDNPPANSAAGKA